MITLIASSFKIAVSSLLISKVRTFLTILGIVIGVASVILLVSVGNGLSNLINQQFTSLGVNLLMVMPGKVDLSGASGFQEMAGGMMSSKLNEQDLNLIRSIDSVSLATPFIVGFLPVVSGGNSLVVEVLGTDETFIQTVNWSVVEGRSFSKAEIDNGSRVAVVGDKVNTEVLGGNSLGKSVLIGSDRFRVIGVLNKKGGTGQMDWDKRAFITLGSAKRLFGKNELQTIYFKTKEGVPIDEVKQTADYQLLRRHKGDDFSIIQSGDLLKSVESILGSVTLALAGIAAISLIVGGIGIMNIMLVSVSERTREIGLRKAVGASFTDVLWQFLIEAAVLAGLGGVVGITLGYAGSFILGKFISTSVAPWSVIVAFSFSVFVGIIFGIMPAYKAAKLDPIEALRYE